MNAVTTALANSAAPDCPIPVLDAAAFLNGEPGALEPLSVALRDAMENIGFYYLERFAKLIM
ncbi:MAG: hypothetical protein ETSY1_38695 [Candidatus Entotheonella factor]|uniref:Non-haem dioxygenase N-terminal domain-containing protein n=1 Tax=Entotheonella factor TaxID=1429438 RepID=W4L6M2_ENTF1|nr:hypothetical protein [Candidatus Entotheonella palauensis]ETW93549.1 MAG: hypothetical protein ETSY1_38695 [Candidatus Entotheonella factor]